MRVRRRSRPTASPSPMAMPRSLRWSTVRNPAGYSCEMYFGERVRRIHESAAPPDSASTSASIGRPAFSA